MGSRETRLQKVRDSIRVGMPTVQLLTAGTNHSLTETWNICSMQPSRFPSSWSVSRSLFPNNILHMFCLFKMAIKLWAAECQWYCNEFLQDSLWLIAEESSPTNFLFKLSNDSIWKLHSSDTNLELWLKILFKMCTGSLLSNANSSRCLYQRRHYTIKNNSRHFNCADRQSEDSRYILLSWSALLPFQEAAFPLKICVV